MRIHNARWLDPAGMFREGVVFFENGRLRLRPGLHGHREHEQDPDSGSGRDPGFDHTAGTVYDGSERLIIPGLFDPHVHLRQPGQANFEGIRNGTRAALAGGVTSILDMPNNRPPCDTDCRLAAKKTLFANRSLVNWGLHVLGGSGFRDTPAGVAAAKIFMARAGSCPAVTEVSQIAAIMERFPIIAIHGEDGSFFDEVTDSPVARHDQRMQSCHFSGARKGAERAHAQARPQTAIRSALAKIEQALAMVRSHHGRTPRVVLLHISTREELDWVRRMRAAKWDIRAETCFHYLFFTGEDERERGPNFRVNPPLRRPGDREALRQAIRDGTIDWIGTDHAPHPPAAKASATGAPSGMPGLEWAAPLLAMLVEDGRLTWEQALRLGCSNAAEAYGVGGRGRIIDGAPADLVVLARTKPGETPISVVPPCEFGRTLPIVTRAGYNPYARMKFPWRVETVFVNGQRAYHRGTWSSRSAGKELYEPASCA